MACSSCGKKTNISGRGNRTVSAPATPTKRKFVGGQGSPYGSPKVRMSFGRNR